MTLSTEEKLKNAMMNIYHMNLLFLSEFDNELFLRVMSLSNEINNGNYKERYFLEYLENENEFDIYDEFNKKFVLDKKPKKFIQKALDEMKMDTANCIINLTSDLFYFHENLEINDEKDVYLKSRKKLINDYNRIRNNTEINKENNLKIKEVDKLIFVGTLTGRHIIKILEKFNKLKTILICEENLEIFRLSLFVCDYSSFVSKNTRIFFSIMDDDNSFSNHLQNFLNYDIYNNSIIKYYSTNYNVSKYFDRIVDEVLNRNPSSFNYYMTLDNVVKSLKKNMFKYKTLLPKNIELLKSFENSRVLFIGAGPSLSENLSWISENQHKFMVVTMASCIDILINNDIQADLIVTLDPQEHVYRQFFKNEKSEEYLEKSIVLCSHNTDPKVLSELNQITDTYIYQVFGCFNEKQKLILGKSVGEVTFSLLNIFKNIKDVYLIGIDLAINQTTGDTHFSGYDFSSEIKLDSQFNFNFSYRDDLIAVKGNFKDTVFTSRLFYASLLLYNFEMKRINFYVYNISKNGVFIDETFPLNINDIDLNNFKLIDKKKLNKDINRDLSKISVKNLGQIDIDFIKQHIEFVEKIVKKLDDKKINISTYEEFIMISEELLDEILNIDKSINYLKEIYLNFTFTFNNYISYCVKAKENNKKQLILKMIKNWIEVLIIILKDYMSEMTKLLVKEV